MPVWAPVETIGDTIHRRICPLYSIDDRNRPHLMGSAVPFACGALRFLITAAHVCLSAKKTPIPLFTVGTQKAYPLTGKRGTWEYQPTIQPDLDIAVIELSNECADDLQQCYQFSTPADTTTVKPKTPGIHYLIAGYPEIRNRVKSFRGKLPAWLATYLITGDIQGVELFKRFDKTNEYHFALSVPTDYVPRLGGGQFRISKPYGMSGGGVWRLDIDIPRKLATTPTLVGIGIEHYKSERMFVATRVQAVIPLVWDLKRFADGELSDSPGAITRT